MTQTAMRMALEALGLASSSHNMVLTSDPPQSAWRYHNVDMKLREAITALRQALEQQDGDCQQCGGKGCVACDARKQQPVDERKLALHDATQIATWLWKNFYKDTAPQWEVLPNICGVLSQIDNMVAGLKYSADEPVACPYCQNSHTLGAVYFDQNCVECVKRMTRPQPAATKEKPCNKQN